MGTLDGSPRHQLIPYHKIRQIVEHLIYIMSVKTIVLSPNTQLVEHNSDVNKLCYVDGEGAPFWSPAIFDVVYYLHVTRKSS